MGLLYSNDTLHEMRRLRRKYSDIIREYHLPTPRQYYDEFKKAYNIKGKMEPLDWAPYYEREMDRLKIKCAYTMFQTPYHWTFNGKDNPDLPDSGEGDC